MYKCCDCGAEYKTKPQYCDCGNDTFEEIIISKKEFPNPLKYYNISIYSALFFILCIILSILVILFFANPNPQTEKNNQTQTTTKTIPNIETFWDNTPITVTEPVVEENSKLKPVVMIKEIIKPEPPKTIIKQQTPKPVVKEQPKNIIKNTPAKPQTTNSKEVQNYKLRLRNALFYKLNYSAIKGSGKCGIQFAINSDGKLINRAFTFQSDNKTLNDEVYKMLMRLPHFDIPPQEYNGELIKLTIEFNNGEYEVLVLN